MKFINPIVPLLHSCTIPLGLWVINFIDTIVPMSNYYLAIYRLYTSYIRSKEIIITFIIAIYVFAKINSMYDLLLLP